MKYAYIIIIIFIAVCVLAPNPNDYEISNEMYKEISESEFKKRFVQQNGFISDFKITYREYHKIPSDSLLYKQRLLNELSTKTSP